MATIGNLVVHIGARADQLQRELKKAESTLGRFERRMSAVSRSVTQVGRTMTTRITLPIAGAAAAMLTLAANFEGSMNRVQALTGAAGDELMRMSGLARELGATTQFTAQQAADAMSFLAMAGFETNTIMETMPNVLALAAAAQIDLARAADITTNILTGYGLAVDELSGANDALVAAFTSANVNLEQLGQAFKFVGPVARSAGVEFTEAASALALMGNAGIQASMAGTSLRGIVARLLAPSKKMTEIMNRLGVSVKVGAFSVTDLVKQLEKAAKRADITGDLMDLFGLRAGPGMAALVSQGSTALDVMNKKLNALEGVTEAIAKVQMRGLRGAFRELISALQELGLAITDSGLRQWAEDLTRGLSNLVRQLAKTDPKILRLASVIALVAAALGPLVAIFGVLGFAIAGIGASLAALTTLFGALVSPLGAVVALLLGGGGLILALRGVNQGLRDIKDILQDVWDVMTAFPRGFLAFLERFAATASSARMAMDELREGSKELAEEISRDPPDPWWSRIGETIVFSVRNLANQAEFAAKAAGVIIGAMKEVLDAGFDLLIGDYKHFWNAIKLLSEKEYRAAFEELKQVRARAPFDPLGLLGESLEGETGGKIKAIFDSARAQIAAEYEAFLDDQANLVKRGDSTAAVVATVSEAQKRANELIMEAEILAAGGAEIAPFSREDIAEGAERNAEAILEVVDALKERANAIGATARELDLIAATQANANGVDIVTIQNLHDQIDAWTDLTRLLRVRDRILAGDPWERFNQGAKDARELLDRTLITQEQYNDHLERLAQRLPQVVDPLLGMLDALKEQEDAQRALLEGPYSMAELRAQADEMAAAFEGTQEAFERGLRGDTIAGFVEGLEEYQRTAQDVFGAVREATTRAFTAMEDSIVKFVTTGKLSFSEFVESILADLTRIAVRQAVLGPLAGVLLSALPVPGLGTSISGIAAAEASFGTFFAEGGLVSRPTLAVIGEAGPEAVVPLPKLDRLIEGATFAEVGIKPLAAGGIVTEPTLALVGEAGPEAVIPLERNEFVRRWMAGDLTPDMFGLGPAAGGRNQERLQGEAARSEARGLAMMVERAEGAGGDVDTVVGAVESRVGAFERRLEERRFQSAVEGLEGEAGRMIREVLEQSGGVIGDIRTQARDEFFQADAAGRDLGQFADRARALSPVVLRRVGDHVGDVVQIAEASGMEAGAVVGGIQKQTHAVVDRVQGDVERLTSGAVQERIAALEARLPQREFAPVMERVRGFTGSLGDVVQDELGGLADVSSRIEDRSRALRDTVTRIQGEASALDTLTDRAGLAASRVGGAPGIAGAAEELQERTQRTVSLVDRIQRETVDVMGRFEGRTSDLVSWIGASAEGVADAGSGKEILREVVYAAGEIRDRTAGLAEWTEGQLSGVEALSADLSMRADVGDFRADAEALIGAARGRSGQLTGAADRTREEARTGSFEVRETAAEVAAQIRDQAAALLGGVRGGRAAQERFRAGGLEGWVQDRLVQAGGLFSVTPLATGGIVTEPTLALIGEAGPEAVVPLTGPGAASALLPALPGPVGDHRLAREVASESRTMSALLDRLEARGGSVLDMVDRLEMRAQGWRTRMADLEMQAARGVLRSRATELADEIQAGTRATMTETNARVRGLVGVGDQTEIRASELIREIRARVGAEIQMVDLQVRTVESAAEGAGRAFVGAAEGLQEGASQIPASVAMLTDRTREEAGRIRADLTDQSSSFISEVRDRVGPIPSLAKELEARTDTFVSDLRLGAQGRIGEARTQATNVDLDVTLPIGGVVQQAHEAMVGGDGEPSASQALPAVQELAAQTLGQIQEAAEWMMKAPAMVPVALAQGGLVTRPTLALVGEAGPEAVIPLSQFAVGAAAPPDLPGGVLSQTVRSEARALENLVEQLESRGGSVLDLVDRLENQTMKFGQRVEGAESGAVQNVLRARAATVAEELQATAGGRIAQTRTQAQELVESARGTQTQASRLMRRVQERTDEDALSVAAQAQAVEGVARLARRTFRNASGPLDIDAAAVLPAVDLFVDRAWTEADELRLRRSEAADAYVAGLRNRVNPIPGLAHAIEGRVGIYAGDLRLGAVSEASEIRARVGAISLGAGVQVGDRLREAQAVSVGDQASVPGSPALDQIQALSERTIQQVGDVGAWMDRSEDLVPVALQAGGVVTSPTFAVLGESGPEAVIPLPERGDLLEGGTASRPRVTINQAVTGVGDRDLLEAVRQAGFQAGMEGARLAMGQDSRVQSFARRASKGR